MNKTTKKPYRKESKWYSFPVCSKCHSRMSNHEKMYSRGVCPYCGHEKEGTICNTYNVILKEIRHTPIWKIWEKKRFSYVGADEKSINWLKMNQIQIYNETKSQLKCV